MTREGFLQCAVRGLRERHEAAPELTSAMLAELIASYEWMLEGQLPPATRQMLEAVTVDHWRAQREPAVTQIRQWLAAWMQVRQAGQLALCNWRLTNQPAFLASLQASADPLSRALLAVHQPVSMPAYVQPDQPSTAAHQPLSMPAYLQPDQPSREEILELAEEDPVRAQAEMERRQRQSVVTSQVMALEHEMIMHNLRNIRV